MRRGLLLTVAALLAVVVPAALLVWMRTGTQDHLSGLTPDPVPVVMPVVLHEITDRASVAVSSVWGDPAVVSAPPWFGTVTRVNVSPGDVVASGDVVVRIDGVDRVAVGSSDPFWRELQRRDTGGDVLMLQVWLKDAGFFEGHTDGVFGLDLTTSVKAWALSLGVAKPDGVFDPAWVLWLPEDPFLTASVEAARGVPAPSSGSRILEGPAPIMSVSLTDQAGRTFAPDGVWVLTIGDVEVFVVDGTVDDEGLAILALVLDSEQPLTAGQIQRAEPVETLEIPSTAVVSNASGALCVFVPDGGVFSPRPVTLSGGRVSRVDVASGLGAGDHVLTNPTDVLDGLACP